jgi:hypothetical protein
VTNSHVPKRGERTNGQLTRRETATEGEAGTRTSPDQSAVAAPNAQAAAEE